jgi:hypothetical protein
MERRKIPPRRGLLRTMSDAEVRRFEAGYASWGAGKPVSEIACQWGRIGWYIAREDYSVWTQQP